jgi:hypothetical protein
VAWGDVDTPDVQQQTEETHNAASLTLLQREIDYLKQKNVAVEAEKRRQDEAKARELDRARKKLADLRRNQAEVEEKAAADRRRAKELERKLAHKNKQEELAKQEAQVRRELELAKRRQLDVEFAKLEIKKARIQKLEAEKKLRKLSKRKEKEAKKRAAARAVAQMRHENAEATSAAAASKPPSLHFQAAPIRNNSSLRREGDDAAGAATMTSDERARRDEQESMFTQLSLIGSVLDDSPPRGASDVSGDPLSWTSDPPRSRGGSASGWGLGSSSIGAPGPVTSGTSAGGFGPLADVSPSPFDTFSPNLFHNSFGTSPLSATDGSVNGVIGHTQGPSPLAPLWNTQPSADSSGDFNPAGSLFNDGESTAGVLPQNRFQSTPNAFGEGSFFGSVPFDDTDDDFEHRR